MDENKVIVRQYMCYKNLINVDTISCTVEPLLSESHIYENTSNMKKSLISKLS